MCSLVTAKQSCSFFVLLSRTRMIAQMSSYSCRIPTTSTSPSRQISFISKQSSRKPCFSRICFTMFYRDEDGWQGHSRGLQSSSMGQMIWLPPNCTFFYEFFCFRIDRFRGQVGGGFEGVWGCSAIMCASRYFYSSYLLVAMLGRFFSRTFLNRISILIQQFFSSTLSHFTQNPPSASTSPPMGPTGSGIMRWNLTAGADSLRKAAHAYSKLRGWMSMPVQFFIIQQAGKGGLCSFEGSGWGIGVAVLRGVLLMLFCWAAGGLGTDFEGRVGRGDFLDCRWGCWGCNLRIPVLTDTINQIIIVNNRITHHSQIVATLLEPIYNNNLQSTLLSYYHIKNAENWVNCHNKHYIQCGQSRDQISLMNIKIVGVYFLIQWVQNLAPNDLKTETHADYH